MYFNSIQCDHSRVLAKFCCLELSVYVKPTSMARDRVYIVRYFHIISRNVLPHIQISAIKIVTGLYEG